MNTETVIAFATIGLVIATGGLVWATIGLWSETKKARQDRLRTEKRSERADVRVWLASTRNMGMPMLEVLVGNVGQGVAETVRWWYEDVDEEDWKLRVLSAGWADSESNAAGVDVLLPNEKVENVLSGGRNLFAPTGTGESDYANHYPVRPFSVVVTWTHPNGQPDRRKTRIKPKLLYQMDGAALHPIARIADALEKLGTGPNHYAKHPLRGIRKTTSESILEAVRKAPPGSPSAEFGYHTGRS